MAHVSPLTANVPHHIETSQMICNGNELTGVYMMGNIGRYALIEDVNEENLRTAELRS